MHAVPTDGASPSREAATLRARTVASIALKLAYPVVILAFLRVGSPRYIGLALLVLFWLQRWLGAGGFAVLLARLTRLEWAVAVVLSGLSAAIAATDSETLLRAYPIAVNAGMLTAFGATLRGGGPSMIERFARLRRPDLDASAIRYTRRVTLVWCAFFMMNGAASAACAWWGSREQWAVYNGVVTYLLIGVLIGGEFAWRHAFVLRRSVP